MMNFEIEKNVPLEGIRPYSKYPFQYMEVGDSFVAPIEKRPGIAAMLTRIHKDKKMKFVTRMSNDRKSIRVWRLA